VCVLYDDDKATTTAMDLYLDTCISSWHFIARIRVIIATVTYIIMCSRRVGVCTRCVCTPPFRNDDDDDIG